MKNSAKGRLAVVRDEHNRLSLINQATPEQERASLGELEPGGAKSEPLALTQLLLLYHMIQARQASN